MSVKTGDGFNEPEAVELSTLQAPAPTTTTVEVRVKGVGKALLAKLASRKFWLAVGTVVTFIVHHDLTDAMYTALAYLGVQGATDAINAHKK